MNFLQRSLMPTIWLMGLAILLGVGFVICSKPEEPWRVNSQAPILKVGVFSLQVGEKVMVVVPGRAITGTVADVVVSEGGQRLVLSNGWEFDARHILAVGR